VSASRIDQNIIRLNTLYSFCVTVPLLVNVSVLLLSLASPDESSLVKEGKTKVRQFSTRVLKCFCYRFRLEVWGGISATTAMVRPASTVLEPEPIRFPERHTPSRRHLVTGHVFHHARRFQNVANTGTLFAEDLQKRQRTLSDEVIT